MCVSSASSSTLAETKNAVFRSSIIKVRVERNSRTLSIVTPFFRRHELCDAVHGRPRLAHGSFIMCIPGVKQPNASNHTLDMRDWCRNRCLLQQPCFPSTRLLSGLCGLFAFQLLGKSHPGCRVVLTDAARPALELIAKNAERNTLSKDVSVHKLRWGDMDDFDIQQLPQLQFDCVIAADCMFAYDTIEPILRLVGKLLHSKGMFILGVQLRFKSLLDEIMNTCGAHGLHATSPPAEYAPMAHVIIVFERQ